MESNHDLLVAEACPLHHTLLYDKEVTLLYITVRVFAYISSSNSKTPQGHSIAVYNTCLNGTLTRSLCQ